MTRELTGVALGAVPAGLVVVSLLEPTAALGDSLGRSWCARGWDGFFCSFAVALLTLAALGGIGAALDGAVLWALKVPGWCGIALWSIPFAGCGAMFLGALLDWIPRWLFAIALYLLGNSVFFLIGQVWQAHWSLRAAALIAVLVLVLPAGRWMIQLIQA
ncbi:hypothetical protein HS041_27510 [Planomonospora sp. ID67723]|uniref:hypothetical protein n=1 Tax=Planomonospora sp. ID67723 TaxID=2738134 RepID=UPI0018C352F4|nr:hypothetical protein [Planomonospora sp. ID67723]MBG0831490.1 hypothetical protein [Planomonospora sp. ID67723]